jgi:hypothetical protein
MKKILVLALVSLVLISCSRHGIIKSYAYVRKSVAGTVRADDNGRQMNSGITMQHLLFVETDSLKGMPEWQTAWIDQKPYSIRPVLINTYNQAVGKTVEGKDVSIAVKKGRQLWQLVLSPKQNSVENADLQEKIKKSKILLSGTWKGKSFTHKISKEKELQRLEFQ